MVKLPFLQGVRNKRWSKGELEEGDIFCVCCLGASVLGQGEDTV